jgi:DNA-binding MarR family transcriptional regulator
VVSPHLLAPGIILRPIQYVIAYFTVAEYELLQTAAAVRRGVTRLSWRLRIERRGPGEPFLQLSMLAHLSRHGPMSPGKLAAAERVRPQSLTRTLASLEEHALITRHPDPADGRRSLMAITEAGRLMLGRDLRQRDAWLAHAMAGQLTPTERGLLRLAGQLLERLAEADDVTPRQGPRRRQRARTAEAAPADRAAEPEVSRCWQASAHRS